MATLGWVFVALVGVGVVGSLTAVALSVSDIKRYRRIRRM